MERIDLGRHRHAELQRWRNGGEWDRDAVKVAVGTLADGRWYVERYRLGGHVSDRACAYAGPRAEWYARGTARRWMRTVGGEWVGA